MNETQHPPDNYIITIENDGSGYALHGPFDTVEQIKAYGTWWQFDQHDDNPLWQSIYLANPHAAPRVVAPVLPELEGDYGKRRREEDAFLRDFADAHGFDLGDDYFNDAPGDLYMVTMVDDDLTIYGPFPDLDALCTYGHMWQVTNHDSLHWQSTHMVDPFAAPHVITPSDENWVAITGSKAVREKQGYIYFDKYD
jgi:hypothetical protein